MRTAALHSVESRPAPNQTSAQATPQGLDPVSQRLRRQPFIFTIAALHSVEHLEPANHTNARDTPENLDPATQRLRQPPLHFQHCCSPFCGKLGEPESCQTLSQPFKPGAREPASAPPSCGKALPARIKPQPEPPLQAWTPRASDYDDPPSLPDLLLSSLWKAATPRIKPAHNTPLRLWTP